MLVVKTMVVVGPLLDGRIDIPKAWGPLMEEIGVDHVEVWHRTQTYWPSFLEFQTLLRFPHWYNFGSLMRFGFLEL